MGQTQKIVSRWDSSKVLFECEIPDGIDSGLAMRHALEKAVESRANLIGANLSGANLSRAYLNGANLSRANLSGAKWADGIVISKVPLQISGLHWFVTILDAHMQIGCQLHSLADWAAFDDRQIAEMDGRDALRFWHENKDALLGMARAAGREFATTEVAA
jgi:hypothetical protein